MGSYDSILNGIKERDAEVLCRCFEQLREVEIRLPSLPSKMGNFEVETYVLEIMI